MEYEGHTVLCELVCVVTIHGFRSLLCPESLVRDVLQVFDRFTVSGVSCM